jgi:outer membrane lipoprotein
MNIPVKAMLAALILTALAGCAPVISKGVLDTADKNVNFADILKDPAKYTGRTVVVGGAILSSRNLEDRTEIEVLQMPLGYRLKPVNPEESAGRFILVFKGFKDPAIYSEGKKITAVGKVEGSMKGEVGKMPYDYPVISPAEDYLWQMEYEPSIGIGVGVGIIHGY